MRRLELRIKFFTSLFILLFIGYSCSQEEGVGGSCTLKGTIIEKVYNDDYSLLLEEKPAADEDVYIMYGDATVVGDNVKTSYTGQFEFEYLWPGNYTIYYYSKDSTETSSEKSEKTVEVELKKNKTTDLDTLILVSTKDWDEGSAMVEGTVMVTNYKNSSSYPNLVVKDYTAAQEQEVYLVYGNHVAYDERARTGYDGSFAFSNLIKGKYTIYVYSEDVTGGTANIAVIKQTEITEDSQVFELDTLNIEKL